jgi:3-dehydroquinate synthetase
MQNRNNVSLTYNPDKSVISFKFDSLNKNDFIKDINKSKFNKCIIFCDFNVYGLFKNKLKKIKKKTYIQKLHANEKLKDIKNIPKIIKYLEKIQTNKSDLILIIGGGTVSDLISFCCSIYMRGLSYWAIPTTLMSQVDALSAGKTCINTNKTKNLVGTIHYASKVFLIPELVLKGGFFNYRQGLSEIFKYGLLTDSQIIKLLNTNGQNKKFLSKHHLIKIMKLTIHARNKIAKINPLASNLGHTFGHALEKIYGEKIKHGDAISAGIYLANYIAYKEKILDKKDFDIVEKIMKKLGLNLWFDKKININKMLYFMSKDKKNTGDLINLVLIKSVGKQYHKKRNFFYGMKKYDIKKYLISINSWHKYLANDMINITSKKIINYK